MNRARAGAWIVLLALAGVQAWSARFYATPDGVSYLDISDAVVSGQFRELLNAYWSPLYPALIGMMRAVLRPSAYWEFGVTHLLNFVLFVTSLLGFEYLISPLRAKGPQWDKPGLGTPWGMAGAYAIFGALTLMMTPLLLPTPDLLVSTACFFVFGALLRLRYDMDVRRSAIVLGVALAAGSLAKSFVIPWAGVCIVTAFAALRGRGFRPAMVSAAIWLAAVVPWTVALSAHTGHLTFGDTGRLTYVWYVNQVESPSGKNMPSAAGTPATDSILTGIAMTPNATGTNPVWYDPARWYSGLKPRFVAARQMRVFSILMSDYIASLAPLFMVIAAWLIVGGRSAFIEWWGRAWVVIVPILAALAAYSLVLVTTRYVAPFYITLTIVVMCAARWPAAIPSRRLLFAVAVPLLAMVATPEPGSPMALINAAAGAVAFVWLARYRTLGVMVTMGIVGALAIRVLQPFSDLRYVTIMSAVIIVVYWLIGRVSDRTGESGLLSPLVRRTLVASNAALVLGVAALKYQGSLRPEKSDKREPNDSWFAAQQAAKAQIGQGARIALVGSPFEAYWVRTARASLVAVVPPPRMGDFNALSVDQRRRLYDEFTRAGATFLVVQQQNPPAGADPTWLPIEYIGWVKRLPIR